MSRKEFDFTDRKKIEVPYSQLKHNLDTRAEGSQDPEFVTKELLPSFKDKDEALDVLLKFPIEVTGDYVLVVGRNFARALQILLGEDDPKIPVEVYSDIPNFDRLDVDDQLKVRTYAISKDHLKTRQRGLKDEDYLFNVQYYVDENYTKEQVIDALSPLGLKKWRIEKLYVKAKGIRTQQQLGAARQEVKVLTDAKKPVNYNRIVERYGLPEKYVKDLSDPTRRGAKTAALNALKNKQKLSPRSKQYADGNFTWYTLSAQGTLATSDFENKTPLSAKTFREITQHHLDEAKALVTLWEGALERANTQIDRLEKARSAKAGS